MAPSAPVATENRNPNLPQDLPEIDPRASASVAAMLAAPVAAPTAATTPVNDDPFALLEKTLSKGRKQLSFSRGISMTSITDGVCGYIGGTAGLDFGEGLLMSIERESASEM